MILRKYMIPVYGRLVACGRYTLDPEDTSKKQVPEVYVEAVALWLAEREQ